MEFNYQWIISLEQKSNFQAVHNENFTIVLTNTL